MEFSALFSSKSIQIESTCGRWIDALLKFSSTYFSLPHCIVHNYAVVYGTLHFPWNYVATSMVIFEL